MVKPDLNFEFKKMCLSIISKWNIYFLFYKCANLFSENRQFSSYHCDMTWNFGAKKKYSRTSQYEFNSFPDRSRTANYSYCEAMFRIEINITTSTRDAKSTCSSLILNVLFRCQLVSLYLSHRRNWRSLVLRIFTRRTRQKFLRMAARQANCSYRGIRTTRFYCNIYVI